MMNTPQLDHPLTGPFWKAAARQELQVTWCGACNHAVWYPRANCPDCGDPLHWRALSGEGLLASWCEVAAGLNPNFPTAYTCALVSPVEAPHI
ncbi:MAG TPA: hypothetical protein DCP75_18670, partial [Haliea salexigens]|nr:hypothetical protein [Haliea salexigens]